MSKITLPSVGSIPDNPTSAAAAINSNFSTIQTAFDNTLSRDGTSPNTMSSNLDMNSKRILNIPDATTAQEPVTLHQVSALVPNIASSVVFTPTGGVSSTNVQSAIAELDTKKAAISSLSTLAISGSSADLQANLISWAPTLTFATPGDLSVTYSTRYGVYAQISSHLALVQFDIITSAFTWTTASGNVQITGLPLSSPNVPGQLMRGALTFGGINKASYTTAALAMAANSSTLVVNASGMGQATSGVTAADMPSGGTVNLCGEIVIFI